jgi:hypothetical protein
MHHKRRSIQRDQHGGHGSTCNQIAHVNLAGVKQCDDRNRHNVVDDNRRGEEYAQLNRYAVTEENNDRNGKGRIGPNRNTPTVP